MTVDQTIKQRLVGAIVLVAVAVIFLPGILGKKTERKTFSSKISSPEIGAVSNTLPDEPEQLTKKSIKLSQTGDGLNSGEDSKSLKGNGRADTNAEATPTQLSAQTDQTKTSGNDQSTKTTVAVKKPQIKPSKQAATQSDSATTKENRPRFKKPSWLIQVGSFSSNANARSLAKKLEERKMKAFVRPVNLKQGEVLYRVFVGPWFEKRQAESKLDQVTEITRLKPIVVSWQPNLQ